ncbi:MAG: CARDB domain-containing protein [Alphaproteobacteria bacterium]
MRDLTPPRAALLAVAAALPITFPAAAQAAPDLTARIQSVSPQPSPAGSQLTVRTLLRNQGPSQANLNQKRADGTVIHMVRWYFRENGTGPGKFLVAMSMLGTLTPGGSKTVSPKVRIPKGTRPGRHAVCVVIDPENRVRETNERNNRSCVRVRVSGRRMRTPGRSGTVRGGQPDLIVRNLTVNPATASPGAQLDVKALIRNNGNAVAPGTSSGDGYMVDITLGTDTSTPPGYAVYSPNYSEDVLLKGGRFSNTVDLAPNAMKSYGDTKNQIPTDTPPGKYYVCARVDPGGKVAESNEGNNTRCMRITVRQRALTPGRPGTRPPGAAQRCPGTLPAPRQIAPRNGSKFNHFPRTTRFRWSPVRNARTYGLEVDCLHCCVQGKWCSEVGQAWHVKSGLTSRNYVHDFVGAQPGRWRVWAIDACGKKGKVSGWWKFEYTR